MFPRGVVWGWRCGYLSIFQGFFVCALLSVTEERKYRGEITALGIASSKTAAPGGRQDWAVHPLYPFSSQCMEKSSSKDKSDTFSLGDIIPQLGLEPFMLRKWVRLSHGVIVWRRFLESNLRVMRVIYLFKSSHKRQDSVLLSSPSTF